MIWWRSNGLAVNLDLVGHARFVSAASHGGEARLDLFHATGSVFLVGHDAERLWDLLCHDSDCYLREFERGKTFPLGNRVPSEIFTPENTDEICKEIDKQKMVPAEVLAQVIKVEQRLRELESEGTPE